MTFASKFSTQWLKVSEPYAHVVQVELSKGPVNAFVPEFWRDYGRLFERLTTEAPDTRVVVLSSSLPKYFTAGLDLSEAVKFAEHIEGTTHDRGRAADVTRRFIQSFQHDIRAPERCPFPVISAVHGIVFGLGVDIISACDIRYAAEDAIFSIKEVDIGLAADIGSLAYLPKITGNQSLARELAYTARSFPASVAEKLGLVSKVVKGSREAVIQDALQLAVLIAQKSPIAVSGTKSLLTHARDHSVDENLAFTSLWNSGVGMSEDIGSTVRSLQAKERPLYHSLKIPSKL